jgi:hypothetical protein
MHGEINLQRWLPFAAEQVISRDRGMLWRASVRMHGLPVKGFDRVIDGQGVLRWKILGFIPVVTGSGPDVTRSAAGRLAAESVWLPSVLCEPDVQWSASDPRHLHARFAVQGHPVELALTIDAKGRLTSLMLPRWGNPGGGAFRYVDFGGLVEEEKRFGGCTIPSRLRIGWHFGTERFESDGEFFRVTVDEAEFR